jgi:hypothetical protein
MTRINVIEVSKLCNKHLFAEWREMPRLVKNLEKSLNRKSKPFCSSEIPPQYTLGKGHVKFFYDKFQWLYNRHIQLTNELVKRGYNLSNKDSSIFLTVPTRFINNWQPSDADKYLNIERIKEKMPKNPKFFVDIE